MMMQNILNVAVGERAMSRLKYTKHAHACSVDPRSRCPDMWTSMSEREAPDNFVMPGLVQQEY